jgi:transposase-like protein
MAETKKDALAAFDAFIEIWGVKFDKAVECLIKDRDALLAFYDFPAEHWKHLRTTNPIESSFAIPSSRKDRQSQAHSSHRHRRRGSVTMQAGSIRRDGVSIRPGSFHQAPLPRWQ